jgi:hypothetical protein
MEFKIQFQVPEDTLCLSFRVRMLFANEAVCAVRGIL